MSNTNKLERLSFSESQVFTQVVQTLKTLPYPQDLNPGGRLNQLMEQGSSDTNLGKHGRDKVLASLEDEERKVKTELESVRFRNCKSYISACDLSVYSGQINFYIPNDRLAD